jgi:hypothetical protein
LRIGWKRASPVAASFFEFWVLAGWFIGNAAPVLILMAPISEGRITSFFDGFGEFIPSGILFWLSVVPLVWASATAPGMPASVPNAPLLEYLFSRAVDRRKLWRGAAIAVVLVGMSPLLLNLAVSPFEPKLRLTPGFVESRQELARTGRYLAAFPGSGPAAPALSRRPAEVFLRRGTETFAGWLCWMEAFCFVFSLVYCSLTARWLRRDRWITALIPFSPGIAFMIAIALFHKAMAGGLEELFLFFAANPWWMTGGLVAVALAIVPFCERRFADSEVL